MHNNIPSNSITHLLLLFAQGRIRIHLNYNAMVVVYKSILDNASKGSERNVSGAVPALRMGPCPGTGQCFK